MIFTPRGLTFAVDKAGQESSFSIALSAQGHDFRGGGKTLLYLVIWILFSHLRISFCNKPAPPYMYTRL